MPIMGSDDRARREAELARERAAEGNAYKVLVWKLPSSELAPAVRQLPNSTTRRRLVQPETPRSRQTQRLPGNVSPGQRLPGLRRVLPESPQAVSPQRIPQRNFIPGYQGRPAGPSTAAVARSSTHRTRVSAAPAKCYATVLATEHAATSCAALIGFLRETNKPLMATTSKGPGSATCCCISTLPTYTVVNLTLVRVNKPAPPPNRWHWRQQSSHHE